MLKNPVFADNDYLAPCDQPGPSGAIAVGKFWTAF